VLQNAVKHTYSSLGFQNFSGGNTPGAPAYKGRGGEGRGEREERGEGREGRAPQQCLPQGPHQPKSGPAIHRYSYMRKKKEKWTIVRLVVADR